MENPGIGMTLNSNCHLFGFISGHCLAYILTARSFDLEEELSWGYTIKSGYDVLNVTLNNLGAVCFTAGGRATVELLLVLFVVRQQ